MDYRVEVTATVKLPGWHHWPNASPNRYYLGASHRHMFEVTAAVEVTDPDRQVEFHDLQDLIRGWWPVDGQLGSSSCEQIAASLAALLHDTYGLPVTRVEVSEDGEASAVLTIL